ncbi:hypothetical protein M9435_004857 [Picochlorum sp. BPE23]|nr:hypothetical protein M9435_004857 [Picochlorum sp. BPE23]
MASVIESSPVCDQPQDNGYADDVLSTDALAVVQESSPISESVEYVSSLGMEDAEIDSEPAVLPVWACSYCGLYNPKSVMQCVSTGKWFCNGRMLGKISCIVHHALRSGCREFRMHESVALESLVAGGDLCCCATGTKDILSLGYVSTGNKMTILSKDVFDDHETTFSKSVRHAESDWAPLIQDKMVVDWLVSRPSQADMCSRRNVSVREVNKLEDLWKRGKVSAVIGDVQGVEAPREKEEILPVALAYSDAPLYKSVFSSLIDLEARTSRYVKQQLTQVNVDIFWSTLNDKPCAQFQTPQRLAAQAVQLGDRILISHPSYTWKCECIISEYNQSSKQITALVGQDEKKSAEQPPRSTGYRVDFVWKGAQYDRMHEAFNRIVNDDDCLSSYLRHKLLGQECNEICHKFCMEFKIPDDLSVPGLARINPSQERAIKSALTSPLSLIQGPPGTGKTTTAAAIIYHLTHMKSGTILVATPSNTAADNIAERVERTGVRVTRILSKTREAIGSSVNHLTLASQIKNLPDPIVKRYLSLLDRVNSGRRLRKGAAAEFREIKSLLEQRVLQSADVICVTCVCAGDKRLSHMKFQTVLIDECTQSIEAETLIPIAKGCEHLILIGDQCQLGPVVINRRAKRFGLGQSLFERIMQNHMDPIRLNVQYRMHPALSLFPSKTFYEGTLEDGLGAVDRPNTINFPWPSKDAPMMFWSQHGIEEMSSSGVSYLNRAESIAISSIVTRLLESGTQPSSIGVITPYDGQREQITSKLIQGGMVRGMSMADVEVSSVDAFQGREKDFIIFSCVRSNEFQGVGFLSDPRRLNVSITRARYGLIMLGNPDTLVKNPLWERLLCHFSDSGALVEGPALDSLKPCPLPPSTMASSPAVPTQISMSDFHPVEKGGDHFDSSPRPTASDRHSALE